MNADRSAIAAPLVLDEAQALLGRRASGGAQAPTGARRRGWVIRQGARRRRRCRADPCLRPCRGRDRRRRQRRSASLLRRHASGLDRRREALRALRQRRGANRSLDRRRVRGRLPPGHDRCLDPLRRRLAHRPLVAGARGARLLLGSGVGFVTAGRATRTRCLPSDDLLSPEHDHRRGRRRRAARRPQAPEAPRVRDQPGRIRGRLAEGAARRTSPT